MIVRHQYEQQFDEIDLDGIELSRLYVKDCDLGGGATIVQMNAGTKYPTHSHPGVEQAYVISGTARIDGREVSTGAFWHTDPGEVHSVEAITDLRFFVVTEHSIRIINE